MLQVFLGMMYIHHQQGRSISNSCVIIRFKVIASKIARVFKISVPSNFKNSSGSKEICPLLSVIHRLIDVRMSTIRTSYLLIYLWKSKPDSNRSDAPRTAIDYFLFLQLVEMAFVYKTQHVRRSRGLR